MTDLRLAIRMSARQTDRRAAKRMLVLAGLVAVVSLTTAAQAAAENFTVKIGSTRSDLLVGSGGKYPNYHLWGIATSSGDTDFLVGGTGDNQIVANGACLNPALYGTTGYDDSTGQYDAYCSITYQRGTLDFLFGGGGTNWIYGGGGLTFTVTGPLDPGTPKSPPATATFGNYVTGGMFGGDTTFALRGSSKVIENAGTSSSPNYVDARGSDPDYIQCLKAGDPYTFVYAEPYDTVVGCAAQNVFYKNPPGWLANEKPTAPAKDPPSKKRAKKHAAKKHARTKKHARKQTHSRNG